MKKIVIVLALIVISTATVFAVDFYVSPSIAVNVGIGNYFRGFAGGGQFFMDIGFIAIGAEVKADYDFGFNAFNLPVMLLLGIGRDFWIGAGYTFSIGSMNVTGSNGTLVPWQYGPFPNTFALGVNIVHFPLPFGALLIQSELTYTLNSPVESSGIQAVDYFIGLLAGLKLGVGVGVEFKL